LKLQVQARETNKIGFSFGDKIKNQASKFTEWIGITAVVMKGVQTAKDMGQAVYDIDTAMTSLYKVTDETDAKYNQFLTSACNNAKELGRSVSSLVEQTATWAKLGYSLDQSSELAKVSSIYANVGEVDDETAVSDLVTAMKANLCLNI
jgi:TP901 family phage tail tape measure protein